MAAETQSAKLGYSLCPMGSGSCQAEDQGDP